MGLENNIPEDWVETTLGEVCEIKYGKDHKKLNDGNIPCFGSGGLMRKVSEVLYDKPSVLIPRKGTLTNLFFIDEPFWTVDTLFYTKINLSKIIPKYLFYRLKTYNLESLNVGSAVPSLTTAVLNQFPFSIPNIQEQKAIAKILTAFDDKIELLQNQNKTLETMAQTIFKEWFGKYQIGDELPEGWRVGKITELFEVRDGTHDSPKEAKTGKHLITSKHIIKGRIKFEESYFISETDFNEINRRSKVDQYDILFSMIGTLGLTYFEQNTNIDYAIKNLALFKTSQKKEFTIYTYLWLTGKHGVHYVLQNKSGSTQEFMSLGSLRNIEFIIPESQILVDFNKLCIPVFKKIQTNNLQVQSLTKTRNILLPKLMSGQVRVNNIKQLASA